MSGKIEAIAAYFCDLDDDSMASLMRAHHGDSAAEWQVMQDALGFGTHGLLAYAIGHGVTPADLAHMFAFAEKWTGAVEEHQRQEALDIVEAMGR